MYFGLLHLLVNLA